MAVGGLRPRVVVTQRVDPDALARLAAACSVVANEGTEAWPRDYVIERAANADALMAFMPDRVDRDFLAGAPRLRIVAAAVKGADNFDAEACAEAGVWLTVVPDLLTAPTVELAIALMIGVARNLRQADALVRAGGFRGWRPVLYGTGIAGSTVGIVGMGAIGRAVAQRLAGFEARLLYCDPSPPDSALERRLGLERVSFEALLGESDFVVLAVSLQPSTLHLVDERALGLMKPGAYLVNPCRGSVVDESAVARALTAGRLAGYAADTFEFEDWARADRPAAIHPGLLAAERTLLTPHLGSATHAARRAIALAAADSILDALAGREPRGAINRPRSAAA